MAAGSSTANTWLGSALGPRYVEVPGVVGQRQAIRWWFMSASLMLYYSRLKLGPFSL